MKRLFMVAGITSLLLTMASISWATNNLKSSKSNINREQKAACIEKATTDQAKAACEKKFAEQANKKGEGTSYIKHEGTLDEFAEKAPKQGGGTTMAPVKTPPIAPRQAR